MYFRITRTKTTSVLQLIRSYRDKSGKAQQKIIVSLGNMPLPERLYKEIAETIEARIDGEESLFPMDAEVGKWVDKIMNKIDVLRRWTQRVDTENITEDEEIADGVLVDRIEHENETELGPSLVLKKAWDELEISNFLEAKGFCRTQINSSMATVFNRLIEPCSEHELPDWLNTVSMDEITGEPLSLSSDDRYYRVSDALLGVKNELELFLRGREESLFNLDNSIILYDLTNSYFEGNCTRNPKAKRGHSKEKRTDCALISLGLAVDRNGFVMAHEVLEGNRNDSTTLVGMVARLEALLPSQGEKRVIVVDGGIATEENLKYLRSKGYDYIVAGKRQSRNEFYEDFCDENSFSVIPGRDGSKAVFVKREERGDELIILCRSDSRRDKEKAILNCTEEKFIKCINELNEQLSSHKSRRKTPEQVNKSIGRLHEKYSRAAKYYTITYDEQERKVSAIRDDEKYKSNSELHGCYFLRSSIKSMEDSEVWKLYTCLTKVETAFRNMKSELGLRPFRHHREDRCDAHAWITVLAYHLMRYVEYTLEQNNTPISWTSLRRLLQTHCYSTLIVPSKDGKIRYIRKPGRPDEKQRKIYQILKINYKNLPIRKHSNF